MLNGESFAVLENRISVIAPHVKTAIASEVDEEKRFFPFSGCFIESLTENLLRLRQFVHGCIDRLCDVREVKVFSEDVSKLSHPLRGCVDIQYWQLICR